MRATGRNRRDTDRGPARDLSALPADLAWTSQPLGSTAAPARGWPVELVRLPRVVDRYQSLVDRLLPGRIVGLYVVGSLALGAYRPGRSDIDLVAVVDGEMNAAGLRRLRVLHAVNGGASGLLSASRGWSPTVNTCNVVFVRADDLVKPVSRITPIASHTGRKFVVGRGFDVNPVMWKELAEHGIAVRGPAPDSLGLAPEPELLKPWCLNNLSSYWRGWADAVLLALDNSGSFQPRSAIASGTLGAPRLHCTIATGDIISKEEAGDYALDIFDVRWHPLIRQGLAFRRRERAGSDGRHARESVRATAEFVLEVIRSARAL